MSARSLSPDKKTGGCEHAELRNAQPSKQRRAESMEAAGHEGDHKDQQHRPGVLEPSRHAREQSER